MPRLEVRDRLGGESIAGIGLAVALEHPPTAVLRTGRGHEVDSECLEQGDLETHQVRRRLHPAAQVQHDLRGRGRRAVGPEPRGLLLGQLELLTPVHVAVEARVVEGLRPGRVEDLPGGVLVSLAIVGHHQQDLLLITVGYLSRGR
jgi:hypothetical protein